MLPGTSQPPWRRRKTSPLVPAGRSRRNIRGIKSRGERRNPTPSAPTNQIGAGVRRAPARHQAGVGRRIPRRPLLHPAGPRALHRRGRRSAPRPRRHARTCRQVGARGQSSPRPQGEGRRRSLPCPSAYDAAADAREHGLRAAQLPEASPRTARNRPPQLGSPFFGVAPPPRLDSADVASAAGAVGQAATVAPMTWMAAVGWQRAGGPLKLEERPAAPARLRPT
jgi:hypothetical protein